MPRHPTGSPRSTPESDGPATVKAKAGRNRHSNKDSLGRQGKQAPGRPDYPYFADSGHGAVMALRASMPARWAEIMDPIRSAGFPSIDAIDSALNSACQELSSQLGREITQVYSIP